MEILTELCDQLYTIFICNNRLHLCLPAESAFRDNLMAMETESETLHRTVDDLKQQGKVKDKACSELKRLKGIITAQDEKV
jgi:hypothetical protein